MAKALSVCVRCYYDVHIALKNIDHDQNKLLMCLYVYMCACFYIWIPSCKHITRCVHYLILPYLESKSCLFRHWLWCALCLWAHIECLGEKVTQIIMKTDVIFYLLKTKKIWFFPFIINILLKLLLYFMCLNV